MNTKMLASESDSRIPISRDATRVERVCRKLAAKDFVHLSAEKMRALLGELGGSVLPHWEAFVQSWNDLQVDSYMADGGRYRKRRHATLRAWPSSRMFEVEPHQPHFQSPKYNGLNGGIARHHEPIAPQVLMGPTMTALIGLGCEVFGRLAPFYPWHIEVHQFRIEAEAGSTGKPTPEGVHRDGVNYVLMVMIRRHNLVNGATTIYDQDKTRLDEFTLQQPLDAAIMNDERVMHGVTPIVQLATDRPATRDVLVITFRRRT